MTIHYEKVDKKFIKDTIELPTHMRELLQSIERNTQS